ncbi:transpeptidase family protein [Candidatus Dependentiae bacterium]|nr:transpeptidase family protein [Candidatus Dependentiae bacterium]
MNFEQKVKKRFLFIIFMLCLFTLVLIYRLTDWMLFKHIDSAPEDSLMLRLTSSDTELVKKTFSKLPVELLKPKQISSVNLPRGIIYDSNLEKLAFSINNRVLVMEKKDIIKDNDAIVVLSNILNISYKELNAKLKETPRNWIDLMEDLQDNTILKEIKKRLKKYENSFAVQTRYKRKYPYKNLLSHVLGFVSKDNRGLYGIENQYDDMLSGKNAKDKIFKEPIGILFYDKKVMSSFSGSNVVLTIDNYIQQIVESEINQVFEEYQPKTISAIVMRPGTGEILAMANRPDFDLNEFNKVTNTEVMRNYCISDWYEPGSTMKVVTASLLVNEKLIDDVKNYHCSGRYSVFNHTYHCFDNKSHGDQKFINVMENSCNIGIIQAVSQLSKNQIYKNLVNFGFGITTGCEIPGERAGFLRKPDLWSGLSKYSISIGQEVTVTPLQLINSLMVIPNGGILLKPIIVKEFRDDNNNIVETVKKPEIIRRVMKKNAADKVAAMMLSVVDKGTGQKAGIKGFKIAGKTGTAQAIDKRGGYSREQSISSFFGFFPVENPQFAILVAINQPVKESSGGSTAAPLFNKIAVRLLEYYEKYPVDNVMVTTADRSSINESKKNFLELQKKSTKNKSEADSSEPIINIQSGKFIMPDLKNKSKRDCLKILSTVSDLYKLKLVIEGSGFLYFQNIKPNTVLKKNDVINLKFKS